MISVEDYLWYVDEALAGMASALTELGDSLANRAPDLPGANSPYAIVRHCLGVMERWGGQVVAGRVIERDRAAEFTSAGSVADLIEVARVARQQLARDLERLDPSAPPRGPVDADDALLPLGRTQGGALIHLYEELAQHRGHVEVTRDLLRSGEA